MNDSAQKLKAALRTEVRAKVAALTREERLKAGTELCQRVRETELWKAAKSILLFAPREDEPDVWPLLVELLIEKRTVALPRFDLATQTYFACQVRDIETDIRTGKFEIREPAASCPNLPLAIFDLILVPGIAFDPQGHRLGRGRGFFDRLLTEVRGSKCGVAFNEQIVPEIPIENHDAHMDVIVTPTRWVKIEN